MTNPTLTYKRTKDNSAYPVLAIHTMTSTSGVDFTQVSNLSNFFDKFSYIYNYGSSNVTINDIDPAGTLMIGDVIIGSTPISVTPTVVTYQTTLGTSGTQDDLPMIYKGEKIVQELKTSPIGFVIGNNPEQYPTDGEKGGYWYELIGQITSTNALSLTDDVTNLVKDIAVQEIKQEVITNVD